MLTPHELARVIADVSYRPGWTFTVLEGHPEGTQLNIRATVVDAYDHDRTVDLSIFTFIPPCRKPSEVVAWLAWRLRRVEVHECDEFLRWRGRPASDPHTTWGC